MKHPIALKVIPGINERGSEDIIKQLTSTLKRNIRMMEAEINLSLLKRYKETIIKGSKLKIHDVKGRAI